MVIDVHTHTFPDKIAVQTVDFLRRKAHIKNYSDGTSSRLLSSMDEAGIDVSVLLPVATKPSQVDHINERNAGLFEESGGKLLSLAAIHPETEDIKGTVRRTVSLGYRGFKIHPVYQQVDICDIRFLRILDAAEEEGLIVVMHAGADAGFPGAEQAVPRKIRKALNEVPHSRMVLAHMGGCQMWESVPEELAGLPVYVDTAFSLGLIEPFGDDHTWPDENRQRLDADGFMKIIDIFGADRVLFGTDSPWGCQSDEVGKLSSVGLPDATLKKIMGENAAKLFGLSG